MVLGKHLGRSHICRQGLYVRCNHLIVMTYTMDKVNIKFAGSRAATNLYRSAEPQKRPYSEVEQNEDAVVPTFSAFKTAREQLVIDQQKKYGAAGRGGISQGGPVSTAAYGQGGPVSTAAYGTNKKSLGTRRGLNSKFVPPVMTNRDDDYDDAGSSAGGGALVRRAGPAASRLVYLRTFFATLFFASVYS